MVIYERPSVSFTYPKCEEKWGRIFNEEYRQNKTLEEGQNVGHEHSDQEKGLPPENVDFWLVKRNVRNVCGTRATERTDLFESFIGVDHGEKTELANDGRCKNDEKEDDVDAYLDDSTKCQSSFLVDDLFFFEMTAGYVSDIPPVATARNGIRAGFS